MASLRDRAIARAQGAGNSGFTNAKKIADLFISSNTNDAGVVTNPDVYQRVIDDILSPYAQTVDGQNLIADYTNKQKKLEFKNTTSEVTVSALREKEYASWYVDDDGSGEMSYRNPAWVAQMTSESLDFLVAETNLAIIQARENDLPTADLNTYMNGLITRADRMRSVFQSFEDGSEASLDGYGYFIDSDPNTGEIRGASFMPTDAGFGGLSDNKERTNSFVAVGNKKIPVYLPFVTDDQGIKKSMLGGVEYEDDGDVLSSPSGGSDVVTLSDSVTYQGVSSKLALGNMYQSFNGKVNIDGSFQKDYVFVGQDSTVYKFADNDPEGMQFLKNMKEAGVVGDNILRLNPSDVSEMYTVPLPDSFSDTAIQNNQKSIVQRGIDTKDPRYVLTAGKEPITRKLGSFFGKVFGGSEKFKDAPPVPRTPASTAQSTAQVRTGSFQKNAPNVPDTPGQSIDGQSSGVDVIDSGNSFFRDKV